MRFMCQCMPDGKRKTIKFPLTVKENKYDHPVATK